MPLADERQWYVTPVQRSALPGGRDILIEEHNGYHPGQAQVAYNVMPRFDNIQGMHRHPYWPPEQDPELERVGLYATGIRVGAPAPGYEAERYTGANVPPWGQPTWYQGLHGSYELFVGLVVPAAVVLAVLALAWKAGETALGSGSNSRNPGEDNLKATSEHVDIAWLNLVEARAHLELVERDR